MVGNFERSLRRLPAEARRDLLRVLESDSHVRADVIRQFHANQDLPGGRYELRVKHPSIADVVVEFDLRK